MGLFSSFFHPEKSYDAAQQQLDNYYKQSQNYYNQGKASLQPYNQYGQNAYGNLSGAMQSLLDPEALQDKWISGYEESPAAQQAQGIAQQHGLNSASALGLMGSSSALDALQSGASQISLNDRQNYLDNLMQKYLSGAGIAQNIFGTGASAAGQQSQNALTMGGNAMNMGQNSAQMAYGRESAPGNLFGNLLGSGIGLIGSALGGPLGGALGAGLSQKMGWSPTGSYNPGSAAGTYRSGGM